MSVERTWWQVFRAPIGLGVLAIGGLACGLLVGDHLLGRVFAWMSLALPVFVILYSAFRR